MKNRDYKPTGGATIVALIGFAVMAAGFLFGLLFWLFEQGRSLWDMVLRAFQ